MLTIKSVNFGLISPYKTGLLEALVLTNTVCNYLRTRNTRLVHATINHTPIPVCVEVETPIHDSISELVTWDCKEHGVKS
jgi:hypothetical protein